jgi:carbon-monoxide dehydrogenase large subunit
VSLIGSSVGRRRDAVLISGHGQFVADVNIPGQLWARVVRSPVAHARLLGVDATAARALAGVVAVLTASDVPDGRIPIRLVFASTPQAEDALQPLLAREVVRYVGEPVAIVLAEDQWVAEDAAELVELDLDPLEVAADPLAAVATGAPSVHQRITSNIVNTIPTRFGDLDAAEARAAVRVTRRLQVQRHSGVPMETRGLVAEYDASRGLLTMWGAAKVKHFNRSAIASLLGLEAESVRLVEVDVGGGFGVRGELYPEDVLVPFAAMHTGRPVKWIEDRAEHFVAANHAREQIHEIEVTATADGRLLSLRDTYWCDQGAYIRTQGILPTLLPASHLPGPYRWEAFSIDAHAVLTHRTPVGTYRGPGMTEATFVRERMLDLVAAELGLDPVELRRRNLITSAELPFVYDLGPESPPIAYDSGDFRAFFDRLLDEAGYEGLKVERDRRRSAGESIGIGVATGVELSGIGPFEDASVTGETDGTFTVRVGVGSLGQGIETAVAQIAAEELRVPVDAVIVHHHDTGDVASGFGSFASRSTVVAGNAVGLAAKELRQRAAAALGADADDIVFDEGRVYVRGKPDRSTQTADLGAAPGHFEKEHPSFSFGAAVSLVLVDRETGRVTPLRHVVAHDVGRAVNPALVRGQLAGAAAQGIAGALYEELPYDEDAQPLAISLADYLMPTLTELPCVDVVVIEHEVGSNPLGVKGAGEAGMLCAPAAVANAVADALGRRAVEALPLTPQNVRALIRLEAE